MPPNLESPGPSKLGIVAGGGAMPGRLVAACRAQGRDCFVLALKGHADAAQLPASAPLAWVGLGEGGRALDLLHEHGVRDLVMVGPVRRPSLLSLMPDRRTAGFLARVGMRALGDDGLLRAIIAELETEGFRVVGVESILGGLLAPAGVWGRHKPDPEAEADIAMGIAAAREHGAADLGQAVVVQQGAILDRESADGTDALIRHASVLRAPGRGPILVKTAKPNQEKRADLPTIGAATVAAAAAGGFAGIAVEAGATLVADRDAAIAAADAAGMFLIGVATNIGSK
jgi:DUF1009 family protein